MIIRPLAWPWPAFAGGCTYRLRNSGDSTSSKKKPQETTFRSTRATDQGLQGDKPFLSLRAMEVSREGQKSLQQPKSAEVLKEPEPLPEPLKAPPQIKTITA
jgi:hypothetical protein